MDYYRGVDLRLYSFMKKRNIRSYDADPRTDTCLTLLAKAKKVDKKDLINEAIALYLENALPSAPPDVRQFVEVGMKLEVSA
jgi:hypothetical protein